MDAVLAVAFFFAAMDIGIFTWISTGEIEKNIPNRYYLDHIFCLKISKKWFFQKWDFSQTYNFNGKWVEISLNRSEGSRLAMTLKSIQSARITKALDCIVKNTEKLGRYWRGKSIPKLHKPVQILKLNSTRN
ncbi:MAG: hypothetical protein HKM23_04110 [Nitrosopumilus sp.]|nr:hypothetical protein [Nitrosopumilus sp.]